MTPEQFDRMVREEIIMRGKIFKAAGAKGRVGPMQSEHA